MLTSHNQEVTVDRANLIEIIRANRNKHEADYAAAVDAWKKALTLELAALAAQTASGDFSDIKIESLRPVSHLDAYDDVLEMLELSVEVNITLDRNSFKNYVKDEWSWKSMLNQTLFSNGAIAQKYMG